MSGSLILYTRSYLLLVHTCIHTLAHSHLLNWFFQIDYPSFVRNFYEEHPEITTLTKQEIIDLKKKMGIKVHLIFCD